MEYLGRNAGDFPLCQAYCPLCGFHLLSEKQMEQKPHEKACCNEWVPSVVGDRNPLLLQWLKDLVYVTIYPDSACIYNIYKGGEFADEDIYVGAVPDIIAPTRRLVVVNDIPWNDLDDTFGPARQYTAHDPCMQILHKAFNYRSNRSVNSVSELYRALEKQCWSETAHLGPRPSLSSETYLINAMSWDHGYLGVAEKRHLMSSNPVERISGWTGYVLSHLQRLENAPDKIYLGDRIAALPQELQDTISQYISWPIVDNSTLEPTATQTPSPGCWLSPAEKLSRGSEISTKEVARPSTARSRKEAGNGTGSS
ncbi:MAG: hypothetical protein Q9173_006091 [Seirophora scorigena]